MELTRMEIQKLAITKEHVVKVPVQLIVLVCVVITRVWATNASALPI